VWALRDALEKERAARRIPADAVIRAESRATKAEQAEATAEVVRVKEECARDRQRACEQVSGRAQ
jgi:hypothetical protein